MDIFKINTLENYLKAFTNLAINYLPKLISAFLILFLGIYTIKLINRFIQGFLEKKALDPTITKFLTTVVLALLRLLLFVSFISNLGIETTSFVAIIGAMGLAVGLSLQGSLSNFAGGVLIILFKPFKVGDFIEAQSVTGVVSEIQIFVTQLITANNQTIFVPNGTLSNGNIINYSLQPERRADLTINIAYDADIKKVKEIIETIFKNDSRILHHPPPEVAVKNLTETAIQIAVRPWVRNEDFIAVCSDILENCKDALNLESVK
jgi:small conductance mechanosensitive channel